MSISPSVHPSVSLLGFFIADFFVEMSEIYLQPRGKLSKTRPYTRQHQSRAGGQGQYSSWAGAVTQI